uniref:DUF402 domain-containing protein n=1 Tax=Panagrellus redivivus TaxID=6233 RepID=A0A7E4ZU99_PANRE
MRKLFWCLKHHFGKLVNFQSHGNEVGKHLKNVEKVAIYEDDDNSEDEVNVDDFYVFKNGVWYSVCDPELAKIP